MYSVYIYTSVLFSVLSVMHMSSLYSRPDMYMHMHNMLPMLLSAPVGAGLGLCLGCCGGAGRCRRAGVHAAVQAL